LLDRRLILKSTVAAILFAIKDIFWSRELHRFAVGEPPFNPITRARLDTLA
jgi:hypothetical protein